MNLCPYCKKRPLIKATCGDQKCQMWHNRKLNKRFYRHFFDEHGESYRKNYKKRAKYAGQMTLI